MIACQLGCVASRLRRSANEMPQKDERTRAPASAAQTLFHRTEAWRRLEGTPGNRIVPSTSERERNRVDAMKGVAARRRGCQARGQESHGSGGLVQIRMGEVEASKKLGGGDAAMRKVEAAGASVKPKLALTLLTSANTSSALRHAARRTSTWRGLVADGGAEVKCVYLRGFWLLVPRSLRQRDLRIKSWTNVTSNE
jgi:hypothetical protein